MNFGPVSNIVFKDYSIRDLNIICRTIRTTSQLFCGTIKCVLSFRSLASFIIFTIITKVIRCLGLLRRTMLLTLTFTGLRGLVFVTFTFFRITPRLGDTTPTLSGLIDLNVGINLLQFFLFLAELIHISSNLENIGKGFCFFSPSDKHFLILSKRNESSSTHLEVKIDTVNQTKGREIFSANTKEILCVQFSITTSKRLTQTRILTLHQLLDTGILNHVDEIFRAIYCLTPVIVRSE